jgi:plastocyanin
MTLALRHSIICCIFVKGKEFDSGFLTKGKTFDHIFKAAGEFAYFCEPHPTMVGKVIVS